jgi:hypothetical protein
MTDATENTAIEVTADKTSDTSGSKEEEKNEQECSVASSTISSYV